MDKMDSKKRLITANQFDIDVWMEWMVNNPESAKIEYPEMIELITETVRETPPYFTAVIIEKTPEHFGKWKNDIENCLSSTREKKIKSYIELIELLLYKLEFNTDIENNAVEKIRPELLEMEAYFTNLLVKPPRKQKKTTYVWQSNPDKELPDLYRLMIDKYKLIAPETTAEQFKAIFTGQSIESIKPIKWTDSNRLLAYFLDSVFNGQNWQSIAGNGGLFLNKKGLKISANDLSVAKKGYIDFGKPKDYEKIDLILKTIKKHSEH